MMLAKRYQWRGDEHGTEEREKYKNSGYLIVLRQSYTVVARQLFNFAHDPSMLL